MAVVQRRAHGGCLFLRDGSSTVECQNPSVRDMYGLDAAPGTVMLPACGGDFGAAQLLMPLLRSMAMGSGIRSRTDLTGD